MSLLIPQTRTGRVEAAAAVAIHGDRYVDCAIALDGEPGPPVTARIGAADCPEALAPGDRVRVRIVMGVVVRIERDSA